MNQFSMESPKAQQRFATMLLDWQGSAYGPVTRTARALTRGESAELLDSTTVRGTIAFTRAMYMLRPKGAACVVWSGLGTKANRAFREMPCTATMVLAAPMSTSYDRAVAEVFSRRVDHVSYILEIEVPATARGAEIPGYEHELLFPAGTRIELTGESYEYTDQNEFGSVRTYTVVKAIIVGQRIPSWAR